MATRMSLKRSHNLFPRFCFFFTFYNECDSVLLSMYRVSCDERLGFVTNFPLFRYFLMKNSIITGREEVVHC